MLHEAPDESAAIAASAFGQHTFQTAAASAEPQLERLAINWEATLATWDDSGPAVFKRRGILATSQPSYASVLMLLHGVEYSRSSQHV